MKRWMAVAGFLFVAAGICAAGKRPACISPREAQKQIGTKQCVSAKVLAVNQAPSGVTSLAFCAESKSCPFSVVVLPADSEYVGDVSELVGRTIEFRGKIKESDGRAQIVLRDADQMHGDFPKTPLAPTEFDVEKHGKFGAGTFHAAKAKKASRKAPVSTQTTFDIENPED